MNSLTGLVVKGLLLLATILPTLSQATGFRTAQFSASWGMETFTSPAYRLSTDGSLIILPNQSTLSGHNHEVSASGVTTLGGDDNASWTVSGRLSQKRSTQADLNLDIASADAIYRVATAQHGTWGIGPTTQTIRVANQPFNHSAGFMADWLKTQDDGSLNALSLELAKLNHASNYSELDARVLVLTASRQWTPNYARTWEGITHTMSAFGGFRGESNAAGVPGNSNRGPFLRLQTDLQHGPYSLNLAVYTQVARYSQDPGNPDNRRDRFTVLDAQLGKSLGERTELILSYSSGRNHSRMTLYEGTLQVWSIGLRSTL